MGSRIEVIVTILLSALFVASLLTIFNLGTEKVADEYSNEYRVDSTYGYEYDIGFLEGAKVSSNTYNNYKTYKSNSGVDVIPKYTAPPTSKSSYTVHYKDGVLCFE